MTLSTYVMAHATKQALDTCISLTCSLAVGMRLDVRRALLDEYFILHEHFVVLTKDNVLPT